MAKTQIKILLTSGDSATTTETTITKDNANIVGANNNVAALDNKNTMVSKNAAAIGTALLTSGKMLIDFGMKNYGDFTGDYVTQNKINVGLTITNEAITAGAMMMTMGPLAGGIVYGVSLGTRLVTEEVSRRNSISKQKTLFSQELNRRGRMLSDGGR